MARASLRPASRTGLHLVTAACTAALAASAARAQTPVPVDGEFQVNTYTTNAQDLPSVAADEDGDLVAVWSSSGSSGTDASFSSIQGQRYASDGTPLDSEFQINTYTTNGQTSPSVAADANGDFVVVWASLGSSGADASDYSIHGQRYASDGTPLGSEFQINTYTTNRQAGPTVATDADGDFVVVWRSAGSSGTDTSDYSVQGQRYASDGTPRGSEFQVNTYTTNRQESPAVAAHPDGDFVVVWESFGSSGADASDSSIQGQRYASNGTPRGSEFEINTYITNGQDTPSVAAESDGGFVVV